MKIDQLFRWPKNLSIFTFLGQTWCNTFAAVMHSWKGKLVVFWIHRRSFKWPPPPPMSSWQSPNANFQTIRLELVWTTHFLMTARHQISFRLDWLNSNNRSDKEKKIKPKKRLWRRCCMEKVSFGPKKEIGRTSSGRRTRRSRANVKANKYRRVVCGKTGRERPAEKRPKHDRTGFLHLPGPTCE